MKNINLDTGCQYKCVTIYSQIKINRDLLNDSRYNLSEMSDNIIRNVKQEHHIGAKNKPKNNHDGFWATVMSIFSDPTTIF